MLNTNDRIIKHKVGLLNLAEELGNVSKACQMMGLSRDTFYRYKAAVDEGGVDALFEVSRRKPNLKNRTDPATEEAVLKYALEEPAHGQVRTSNELRKRGAFISPSGVRSVWLRHGLENFKLRLKALEEKVAAEGLVLTESQVQALERKKLDDEACGEIETAHPGYLGSQDTFYVGTLKGVGRVYQQTFVDTYSKIAHCKLYTTKTPITAADLLNDRVQIFRPKSVPPFTAEIVHDSDPHQHTTPTLSEGANQFVRVRACDETDRCTDPVSFGPVSIDLSPPSSPVMCNSLGEPINIL